jgi:hypothetical protein
MNTSPTKKVNESKNIFLDQVFDVKAILGAVRKYRLERILFVPFILLIFSHIAFGYTITLHRLLLLIVFTLAFSVLYTLYLILKRFKFFQNLFDEEKYQELRPLIAIVFIALFVLLCYIFIKLIPKKQLRKYDFRLPKEHFNT